MSDEHDDASKTEEPTSKKLDDARKKGQTISTRELNHFFMLGASIFFLSLMAPRLGSSVLNLLSPFITRPESYPMDAASVSGTLRTLVTHSAMLMLLTLLLMVIAALMPAIVQGKWVFAAEQIKPKLSKISPMSGFKKIYGKKALIEFLKNFVKIGIVGAMSVLVVMPYIHQLPGLLVIDADFSLMFAGKLATRMLVATVMFLFLLSLIDYLYQRFSFLKSMRMTKQEVKDEYKQQEGDPHYKGKLKQMRTERARKRMMANVPKADVIITNPTHYAVALQYDTSKMAVPKVVAKGIDDVAARIRELAREHKITIVRNPPLARLLYDTTEIDDEIPAQQYQAVAKIIGYVYRLKGKRPQQQKPGGYSRPKPRK